MRVVALSLLLLSVAGGFAQESTDLLRDAAAAYQAGDNASAIRLYREFLSEHPNAAEIRSNLGAALVRDGRIDEAIDEYQAALKDVPNNTRIRTNLALGYYKLGRISEAAHEFELVNEKDPLELKPALLLAECFLQSDQAGKAVDLLTPLVDVYPDERAVSYLLGAALLRLDRTEEAKQVLDRVLKGGESAEAEYLLGQSEYAHQNPVAAGEHLSKAVALNPKLPGLHSLYGQVLRSVSKLDESSAQFHKELEVNAFDFVANTEVAMELKQEGKLDEALEHIQRALQVRPADPGALYQRASIHIMQGHLDQARQEFEQLVHDVPLFAEAHAGLATVYYKLKRVEDGNRERDAARKAQMETEKNLEAGRAGARR